MSVTQISISDFLKLTLCQLNRQLSSGFNIYKMTYVISSDRNAMIELHCIEITRKHNTKSPQPIPRRVSQPPDDHTVYPNLHPT